MAFFLKGVAAALLRDCPDNVHFLGWREDMADLYKKSTVVLRLTEHDGWARTVVEGLAMARHVIYTYPVPFATKVGFDDVDGTVAAIRRLQTSHDAGLLTPNMNGRRWAVSAFDQAQLVSAVCEALTERLGECPGRKSHCSANGIRIGH